MAAIHQSRHGLKADIHGSAIPCHTDDVWKRSIIFALACQRFIGGLNSGCHGPAIGDLGMDPGDRIGGAEITRIRHIHAAGRSNKDGVFAGRLCYETVVQGRTAAGTGPVSGHIHLLSRRATERLDRFQNLFFIIKCLHH